MLTLAFVSLAGGGGWRLENPGATLAPCAVGADGALPEWIHIVPRGRWAGHPTVEGEMVIDDAACAAIVDNFTRRAQDVPVDHEHQSILAQMNGQPAPAHGWIDRLEARPDGVWGHVRSWTSQAAEWLRSKAYRFQSPVIYFHWPDPISGADRGMWIHSVALTNVPFFVELAPVAGSATPANPGASMLILLAAALALPPTSTEAEVKAQAEALHKAHKATCRSLGLPETASPAEVEAKLATVDADLQLGRAARKVPAVAAASSAAAAVAALDAELSHDGYVPVEQYLTASAAAAATTPTIEVEIDQAAREGRITVAQVGDYKALAKAGPANCAAVRKLLARAPVVVPVTASVTPAVAPGDGAVDQRPPRALTADEAAICRQLGLSPKEFLAAGVASQGA